MPSESGSVTIRFPRSCMFAGKPLHKVLELATKRIAKTHAYNERVLQRPISQRITLDILAAPYDQRTKSYPEEHAVRVCWETTCPNA